jgi:hypothetical protein
LPGRRQRRRGWHRPTKSTPEASVRLKKRQILSLFLFSLDIEKKCPLTFSISLRRLTEFWKMYDLPTFGRRRRRTRRREVKRRRRRRTRREMKRRKRRRERRKKRGKGGALTD